MTNAFRRAALAGSFLAAVSAAPAFAADASSTLSVSANVTSNCAVSTTPLAFGNVDVTTGAAVNGTGGLSVTCTNGTAWSAAADQGAGTGADLVTRKLANGSNLLDYRLYIDSNRSEVWGDGADSTSTFIDTGTGSAQSKTIYGRILAGQNGVTSGAYADTVTVTVTY
ncbi:MAG TPA: spore coat U domain-containing protein [Allosphingosinicella sp.]|jgi:spore coat protein U-like protein